MSAAKTEEPLRQLLARCCDQASVDREAAWREFIRRYKMYIYQVIMHRCINWRVSRLRRQLSDVVNDVVSEVFVILFKSLAQYREVDDEKRFRLWLATMCNRATGRYLKREFVNEVAEQDVEEFQDYIGDLPYESRWELYESVVDRLRHLPAERRQNMERDINIFHLYTWSDLSQPMIQSFSCHESLGHRVIDNVVNRFREFLRDDKNNPV